MLRRWGSSEAAKRARPGKMPATDRRSTFQTVLRRYATVAAVALPIVGAAVLLYVGLAGAGQNDRVAAQVRPSKAEFSKAEKSLTQATADMKAAQAELVLVTHELDAAKDDLAKLDEKFQNNVTLLGKADTENASLFESLTQKQTELNEAILAKNVQVARLTTVAESLGKANDDLTTARADLAKVSGERDDVRQKLNLAAGEAANMKKSYLAAIQTRDSLQAELDDLKNKYDGNWRDAQRAYLSVAAPEEYGVVGRQAALRKTNMIERAAAVHTLASPATKRTVDRLEVVLIHLDLANPADMSCTRSVADLVQKGELIGAIDNVLVAGKESQRVREWLLEAKFILSGVGGAI